MVYLKVGSEEYEQRNRLIPFTSELKVRVEEMSPRSQRVWLYLDVGSSSVCLRELKTGYYTAQGIGYGLLEAIYGRVEQSQDIPNLVIGVEPLLDCVMTLRGNTEKRDNK